MTSPSKGYSDRKYNDNMKQSKALAILKSGKNVFLTGSAGTGKTHLLNQYIQYLRERKVPVAVTASTGIAATHMNGQTIHSWCGMGIKDKMGNSEIEKLREKGYLKNKLEDVQVLIIDEVSMLHRKQIDLVNRILKRFKSSSDAFGGIQVILSGDFFQLPPVTKGNESNLEKFAFMSEAWLQAKFQVCYLTEQFRQNNNALHQILDEMRSGKVSEDSKQLLLATSQNHIGDEPTKLYTHNRDVDRINKEYLDQLPGNPYSFRGEMKGNPKMAEQLKKAVLAPETLILKKGAKVMFVKNDRDGMFVNGTIGIVVDFEKDDDQYVPVVKTTSGKKIFVESAKWSIQNEKDSELVSFTQIPLRLGWAITVHKSQGMTLDCAEIDLRKTFERGQGYVAISRLRDLEGMKLIGLNEVALQVDDLAWKADFRFRELSADADNQNNLADLEKSFDPFILMCGGTTDPIKIKRKKNKIKSKKEKKNTYEITKELLEKQMTIAEIANERSFSEATIIKHIRRLIMDNVKIDISSIKPEEEILDEVLSVATDLVMKKDPEHFTDKGHLKLSPIFKVLGDKYDYNTLRLCMLFFEEQVPSV
jgi:DNA polymerase III delta prime subunit